MAICTRGKEALRDGRPRQTCGSTCLAIMRAIYRTCAINDQRRKRVAFDEEGLVGRIVCVTDTAIYSSDSTAQNAGERVRLVLIPGINTQSEVKAETAGTPSSARRGPCRTPLSPYEKQSNASSRKYSVLLPGILRALFVARLNHVGIRRQILQV